MDLKALIAKMDQIESKKFLTEDEDRKPAKKQEREVELPSGSKVKATKVQGWQSQKADKEADKESKRKDEGIVFRSGIAQELLREFNLDEAGFQFSPEQEKFLGGSDRQDPFILARMPGPKPPLSYFTDPESKQIAQQRFSKVFLATPAGGAAASPAKPTAPAASATTDDDGNTLTTTASGATSVVGPDGKPLPNGGRVQQPAGGQAASPAAGGQAASPAAAVPAGINPETGEKYDSVANAPLQLPPGAAPEAGMSVAGEKPAGGAAASPAKPGADGAVGQDLAKMGVSKKDRLDQAFIDKTLGPGYKAGSAEANLALQAQLKKQGGAAASPAADAGTANLTGQKPGLDASGRANAASDPRVPGNAPQQAASPAAAPAAGGTTSGQNARDDLLARQSKPAGGAPSPASTAPSPASAAAMAIGQTPAKGTGQAGGRTTMANDPRIAGNQPAASAAPASSQNPLNVARDAAKGQAASPAAGGAKTTTTNTSVSGTMKMGKPDGPIQYNGKTVNPTDPEYAAASQALIAQSQKAQAMRRPAGGQPGTGGTISQGVANADRADFEEDIQSLDDSILNRIRAFKF